LKLTPLDTLKALVALQEIDIRIRDKQRDSQAIPRRIDEINNTLGDRKLGIKEKSNQLDEAEMARRMAESDLKAEKEKIKKWEARLADLKNNRDYQALSREIESARKGMMGIEDEILRKMQEIEDLTADIEKEQQELSEEEGVLAAEKAELESKLATINAHIAEEESLREKAIDAVDSRWYKQYQTIRKRRDGVAIAAALDESCKGCNMGIPPQLYNIILRGEQIELCPFCSRILYYEKAVEEICKASNTEEDS
jgi:predicted  nucleic acid-binding Zn-ribbon protein